MQELNLDDILSKTVDLKDKKVGYVTIIWRPNAGKSTFINNLLWEKVSIVSNIPQTTRKKILAIYNDEESQIIFFDTPWIHESEKMFNEEINKQALSSIKEAQVVLYFVDSSRVKWDEEKYLEKLIEQVNIPVIKVFTKTDLPSKTKIEEWENIYKISSINKAWFEDLIDKVKTQLEDGPMLYPEEVYTQQDMFFRISEVIREKVFLNTKEELPHSTFIWVEEIDDSWKMLKIVAYVYTESESQKYIVIWSKWTLIQKIWTEARKELETIFDRKVFLALRAKSKNKWRKNVNLVRNIFK